MTREYTNKFHDLMSEGILTADSVVNMCLSFMSEDDVKEMWEANCMDD